MKLSDSPNQRALIVENLVGHDELIFRLAELGFTRGESVRIVGRSLFRSPIYVEIRGTVLSMRKSEAECIHVQMS